MNIPKVFIILLNWNGWEDTVECLESVQRIDYPDYQAVVVDNGSTDGSIEKMVEWTQGKIPVNTRFIKSDSDLKPLSCVVYNRAIAEAGGDERESEFKNLPPNKRIVFIKNEKNSGYAEGNNIGIIYALKKDADFVFILNNDTVVDKKILREFLEVGKRFPDACYGAKIYYYDRPEKVGSSGVRWDWIRMKFIHLTGDKDGIEEVAFVLGAAFLLSRRIIEKIGFLDTRLFLWDETDLCFRTRKAGYKILLVPSAVVYHKVSSSFKRIKVPMEYFDTRSRFLWAEKHLNIWWRLWLFLVFLFEFQGSLRYCIGLTKEYLLTGKKPEEKTAERVLRLKMKIYGFKDYILRRFNF
jgi:GT2 family glycosyltransferase